MGRARARSSTSRCDLVGGSDGHSRAGASNSYSSWYQTSPGWSGSGSRGPELSDPGGSRGELAREIRRRPRVSLGIGIVLALGFAILVTPAITAERWLPSLG